MCSFVFQGKVPAGFTGSQMGFALYRAFRGWLSELLPRYMILHCQLISLNLHFRFQNSLP